MECGMTWAAHDARYEALLGLEKLWETVDCDCFWEGEGVSFEVYRQAWADGLDCFDDERARDCWEEICGEGEPSGAFVKGFVGAALVVLEEFRKRLGAA